MNHHQATQAFAHLQPLSLSLGEVGIAKKFCVRAMRQLSPCEAVSVLTAALATLFALSISWRVAVCLFLIAALGVVVVSGPPPPPPPSSVKKTTPKTTTTALATKRQPQRPVKPLAQKLTGDAQRANIQCKVMAEFLATERSYVGKLAVIRDVFLAPLRAASPPILTPDQLRTIFSDLEIIHAYNTELLARLERWGGAHSNGGTTDSGSTLTPGDVVESFASVSGYLATYQTYCNNYEAAAATLCALKADTNGAFARFLGRAQQSPRCEGLTLESLLIQPVQRIPRYLLLLRELRKHTPPGSADIAKLDAAIATVARLATKVNDAKGDAQAKAMVVAMQSQLVGLAAPLISEPSRRYVREGLFSFVPDGTTPPGKWSSHRRQLVCFNDLVLVAKARPDSQGRRQVLYELPLRDLRVAITETSGICVLVLSSASKHAILAFASCAGNDDTKSWAELLRRCAAELQAKAASFVRCAGTAGRI